jgi:DNA-binding PadR family transcriptional regulator
LSSTRLLILGVVKQKQPIHGYDVRRELELWNAEKWANIAYGSIYFALNKMTEEGLLEALSETDEDNNRRTQKIRYTITCQGEQEFNRLLREFWWEVKPQHDPFLVAVTFMDQMPREELLKALQFRANNLRTLIPSWRWLNQQKMNVPTVARHIAAQLEYAVLHAETDLRWLEDVIQKVEQGELP